MWKDKCGYRSPSVGTSGLKIRDYVSSKNPKPLPTEINSSFMVRDITDVDENQQTVTLSMKAVFEWQDRRLDVKRSKDDQEKYVNHQLS